MGLLDLFLNFFCSYAIFYFICYFFDFFFLIVKREEGVVLILIGRRKLEGLGLGVMLVGNLWL